MQSEASEEFNMGAEHAPSAKQIIQEGLRVLFHWEYVALVEYVEGIVPLVFVAYKSVLENLPNIR
ncbi:hypothetical protein PPTG_01279 [Phytophthora nicotianae INRA-310]|uniref:Uncharacterized protein n=1 Tax=Phytophthora nicotianae (strain INRA-310) TaxID=761204 RepID=W2R6Q4_PHYN3|nr:hypothetical protein PPTG_01279 [Phytophthora nicotianae INRA-310]ETN20916.1 hypothetical protein PPTG_01279 [Phytophthora nicotianae INRA-310]